MVSSLRRLGEALRIASLVLSVLAGTAASAQIEWRSGERTAVQPMPRAELETKLRGLAAREDQRRVVLQLAGPIDAQGRAKLEADGVRLLGPLGGHAWFASLEGGLSVSKAAAFPGLVRVDAIATVNKLHPELVAGVFRPWATFHGDRAAESEGKGDEAPESLRPTNPIVAVYAIFHADFDLEREARELVGEHGGRIRSYLRSINGAVVHLPASRIDGLAADDAVMWLEPPLPQFVELNDDNRPRVGADVLQDPPYGLDGSGVTVLVYDGGKMASHGDFGDRMEVGASDTASTSDHATHVGGTIGGDGAGSGGQYRGMAPAVDIISYGFEQEGGLSQGFLYTDPGDLEADYGEAISAYGADLSNNSIGTNTAPNGFPCEWEGNYGATGALIDSIARGAFGSPFRIVWANGNERQGSARCGETYLTTAPPACAKNHITVGALDSDTDGVTSFTSWGPCDDGRLKPDISAPGCQDGGDGGVTSTSSSGGYTVKCGTSMASPTTAGVAALILERYRSGFPLQPDIHNSTIKAILATTAEDIVEPGPDYQTGYGSIRAVPAVDLVTDGRFVEAQVGQGETYSFLLLVDPLDPELKVTLAWDDPPGTPNVDPVLVNDLDLRVIDSGGQTHYPWTLDPANPSDPAVRNQRDGVNNIEQVVIDNPAPGAYRVEIEGFNIAQGFVQSFSAASTETLINCSEAGILAVDATRVGCSATLGLQVIDCDLNTDDAIVETVAVSVTSPTEPAGESVTLVESAPRGGGFSGLDRR
jgi:subtilisin family serine protease